MTRSRTGVDKIQNRHWAGHGVGRDTVLRSIDILREEGLVFTVPRHGTYVSRGRDTK